MSLFIRSNDVPIEVPNIEDEDLKKDMRKWVQFYTQFARDLASLQGQAAKLSRMNRDVNIAAAQQLSVHGLPRDKVKAIQDLQRRTVTLNDMLEKLA